MDTETEKTRVSKSSLARALEVVRGWKTAHVSRNTVRSQRLKTGTCAYYISRTHAPGTRPPPRKKKPHPNLPKALANAESDAADGPFQKSILMARTDSNTSARETAGFVLLHCTVATYRSLTPTRKQNENRKMFNHPFDAKSAQAPALGHSFV